MLFCFNRCFLYYVVTYNEINPVVAAPVSKPKTMGAATTVDNKTAPAIPEPNVMVIKTLPILLTILATRKYFLLKASRLLISFSKNFCTSDITFHLYACP